MHVGRHVWKWKLAVNHWNLRRVLLFLSFSTKVHCTIVWAFDMLEHYHWAFQKNISIRGWIDIKFVRMCYAIFNYTVKLLVQHPLHAWRGMWHPSCFDMIYKHINDTVLSTHILKYAIYNILFYFNKGSNISCVGGASLCKSTHWLRIIYITCYLLQAKSLCDFSTILAQLICCFNTLSVLICHIYHTCQAIP